MALLGIEERACKNDIFSGFAFEAYLSSFVPSSVNCKLIIDSNSMLQCFLFLDFRPSLIIQGVWLQSLPLFSSSRRTTAMKLRTPLISTILWKSKRRICQFTTIVEEINWNATAPSVNARSHWALVRLVDAGLLHSRQSRGSSCRKRRVLPSWCLLPFCNGIWMRWVWPAML